MGMSKNSDRKTVSDIALAMAMSSAGIGARNHQQKAAMAKWVTSQAMQMANPWSVILTYRNPIAGGEPTEKELAWMENSLRKHFSSLVHTLSKRAYGNTYKRHKKLIKEISFIEMGGNDRFHIHAIFDVPTHIDQSKSYHAQFKKEVEDAWNKHGMAVEAEEVTGDKTRNQPKKEALIALCLYIVKLRTKYTASCNYTDALLLVE